MRLSENEVKVIKKTAEETWGNNVMVFLFGSRTDDEKRGGDIDLFIQLPDKTDAKNLVQQKAKFLSKLYFLLGEQKIDVIIKTPMNQNQLIIETAKETGIPL